MDLRSIINTDGDSSKQAATPVTPVQAHPAQNFRDFSHPPQASPGKHSSQDYGAPPSAGGSYASPSQYQQQQSFPRRPPQPPPIQPPSHHDMQSPHRSYSVQSPYTRTPSSTSSQYPFPQTHQTPQSPAQHAQFPPPPQRDIYAQQHPPSHGHLQQQVSFPRQSPTPQTPPIGIPGAPHPFLQHQRSVSTVSNPTPTSATPTSAQGQQHYFQQQYQQQQESPGSVGHFPPSQIPQHQRHPSHQSQPGTPLGPPLTQRQSAAAFAQPASPVQQRGISGGSFSQFPQNSPVQQAPPQLQRMPSTPSAYDSQRTSLSEQQRRSQSERERSASVSPKTRLPSQPRGEVPSPHSERGYNNSVKRKMDDRETSVEAPRRMDSIESQQPVNGDHQIPLPSPVQQQPPKKRIRYTEPPIWAQSIRDKAGAGRGAKINGKQPLSVQPVAMAQTARPETNGAQPTPRPGPQLEGKAHPSVLLGPWEESILGVKPNEQVIKLVADFLFLNVVSRGDLGELASRGVEIEIEAKLGQLIDKETNERYQLPVKSECILTDNGRVGFRSSMTEGQHRALNEYLNARVQDTHPQNPASKKRVPIDYHHLRETDSFYELPQSMHGIIPPALREKLNPRHAIKVRVTHNQKTKDIKAKIIKARICDLDIYNPQTPLDCRISINFEMRFDGDVAELGERSGPDRNKDRLSYTQSLYQIDLTQVTQLAIVNGANQNTKEHELEIELQTAALREHGQRVISGEPNEYLPLVEGFIDNMRVLSRATPAQ